MYGYKGDEEAILFHHKGAVPEEGQGPFDNCNDLEVRE
jgi:hypothetical protein